MNKRINKNETMIEKNTEAVLKGMLGIAKKSGNLVSGELAVKQAVQQGAAELVIVAADASANTKKLFNDKCTFYDVPVITAFEKTTLGRAIGCEERSSAAVTDKGIADAVISKLYIQK